MIFMPNVNPVTEARRVSVLSSIKRAHIGLAMLWLCSLLISSNLYAQGPQGQPLLQASVDRSSLTLDETLTLNLRYGKQSLFGNPTFDAIEKDFEILSNNQRSKYQFINGRSESWVQWSLVLSPRRSGTLTIPALSYDDETSQPITITVTDLPTVSSQVDQPVYLEVTLDKDQAFVQEQLLLTMKLFTSVDLNGLNSEALNIENALVTQVSENQYQRTINGQRFGVVEVSYAIFPQQSGPLVIPSLTWTVQVQAPKNFAYDPYSRDPSFGLRGQPSKRMRLRSPEKHIAVAPQPKDTLKQPWLPAQQLSLKQTWSQAPEHFVVGEPITRTIDITAQGLMASQLPPLELSALDGVKYYPDQPQTDDQTNADGVTGTRRESFAIVPNKVGKLTLPAINVSWWDTKAKRMQQASLPAQTINVQNGSGSNNQVPVLPEVIMPAPNATKTDSQIAADIAPTAVTTTARLWPMLSALSFLASLVFASLWWRSQQQLKRIQKNPPRAKPFSSAADEDENKAFKALKQQLTAAAAPNSTGTSRELRVALLHWGKLALQTNNLQDIAALAPTESHAGLALLLQRFDASLYSSQQSQPLSGAEYQQLLIQLQELRQHQQKPADTDALAPLYPA